MGSILEKFSNNIIEEIDVNMIHITHRYKNNIISMYKSDSDEYYYPVDQDLTILNVYRAKYFKRYFSLGSRIGNMTGIVIDNEIFDLVYDFRNFIGLRNIIPKVCVNVKQLNRLIDKHSISEVQNYIETKNRFIPLIIEGNMSINHEKNSFLNKIPYSIVRKILSRSMLGKTINFSSPIFSNGESVDLNLFVEEYQPIDSLIGSEYGKLDSILIIKQIFMNRFDGIVIKFSIDGDELKTTVLECLFDQIIFTTHSSHQAFGLLKEMTIMLNFLLQELLKYGIGFTKEIICIVTPFEIKFISDVGRWSIPMMFHTITSFPFNFSKGECTC